MDEDEKIENKKLLFPKLFRVWKTLIKMMEDRNYQVEEEKQLLNYKQWEEYFKDRTLHKIFSKKDNGEDKLYFEYIQGVKVNGKNIEDFMESLKIAKANTGIILISDVLSPQAKQKIADINNIIPVTYFTISELMVNITEHSYVPKHELLNEDEKKALLKRYKITENQLPKILTKEPVAKYLGLKRGDVVRIIRDSETAGKYVTYRITI